MKNPVFVVTTDGQGYIDADKVVAIMEDPRDRTTCMVYLKEDLSFEVSGSMNDIFYKLLFPDQTL